MTEVIYRGPKKGIALTDADMLMLGRAMIGEGGDPWKLKAPSREHAAALFWCWMDRYLLMNAEWSREGWPFWKLIEQHSIPVKPQTLDPQGSWCKKHPIDCSASNIKRRVRVQSLTVEQLKASGVWQYVEDARDGKLEDVFGQPVYDFASCKRVRGINVNGNCFQTFEYLPASKKGQVIPGEVTIDMPAEEVAGYGGKVLLAIIMGYGLYRLGEYVYEKVTKKK